MLPEVTTYINKQITYVEELSRLRTIFLSLPLEESLKWGVPYYTYRGKNIVGMAAFKQYVGLWFVQGVFLKDRHNLLVNAQEGTTRGLRQWRFSKETPLDIAQVKEYVLEAIENCKQGKEIKAIVKTGLEIPDELQVFLEKDGLLLAAFERFTIAKRREFALHVAAAKQAATKQKRITAMIPLILRGESLYAKYKKN